MLMIKVEFGAWAYEVCQQWLYVHRLCCSKFSTNFFLVLRFGVRSCIAALISEAVKRKCFLLVRTRLGWSSHFHFGIVATLYDQRSGVTCSMDTSVIPLLWNLRVYPILNDTDAPMSRSWCRLCNNCPSLAAPGRISCDKRNCAKPQFLAVFKILSLSCFPAAGLLKFRQPESRCLMAAEIGRSGCSQMTTFSNRCLVSSTKCRIDVLATVLFSTRVLSTLTTDKLSLYCCWLRLWARQSSEMIHRF